MSVQPITAAERDRICSEALNTYLFDNVWNEPVSEYRINIKPLLLKDRSVIGTLPLLDSTIALPEKGVAYYIWMINANVVGTGLPLPSNEWVSCATIATDYRTLINFYGVSGAMFHKSQVYLRYSVYRDTIIIAAAKTMVQNCIPSNSVDNVFLTIYFDSDLQNTIDILSICPENSRRLDAYQAQIDEFLGRVDNPAQLQVYKNGLEITDINNRPRPEVGVYLDMVIDRNIQFAFDVNIVNDNDNPVYYSSKDSCYKQLIHIPKALNPDNKLLTHNTCDFFIRKGDVSGVEGYYLHRASGRTISQVTHNDFGIPLFIMDAYRDYLATQLVNVHVVVRVHDKDNHLVRDASFIDLLYSDQHSDAGIVKILVGNGPEEIPWWKAENLEASKYVEMMFDTPNLNKIEHMPDYVAALGFYQVIQILCKRICDTTISVTNATGISYTLPVLFAGYDVIPIVYRNGKCLTSSQYSYTTNENNTIDISFKLGNVIWKDSEITTVFYINGNNTVVGFIPSEMTLTTKIPYTDAEVYQVVTAEPATQGVSGKSAIAYRKLDTGSNEFSVTDNGDGTGTVMFNANLAGTQFVIFNKYCTYRLTYDLSSYIETGKTIAIPAVVTGTDGKTYPILNFKNVCVYLNGDYLVNRVDYFINDVVDSAGNLSMREIVVQTMDHFDPDGNDILDVMFNIAEIEDLSSGFAIDNRLQDSTPVNLYFPRLTMTHVNSLLERHGEYKGTYVALPEGKYDQGAIFEIQTNIPQFVKDYVSTWAENKDLERIKVMNDYFYDRNYSDPDMIILKDKHRNYSIYLNAILWDIAQGNNGLVDDPDHDRFISQLADYDYLKEIDLCYKKMDRRFIDFYPQYVNYEVDATTKALLDRIIKELMPENQDPTYKVVYES